MTSFDRSIPFIAIMACVFGSAPVLNARQDGPNDSPSKDARSDAEGPEKRPSDEGPPLEAATQPTGGSSEAASVIFMEVPLPIEENTDQILRARIEKRLNDIPSGTSRPICVLEFVAKDDRGGAGSSFERSLGLARFLASDRMSRLRTVAYVPKTVQGHAVLAVLACEEIAVTEESRFGPAGTGEPVDAFMRDAYRHIAERRRTIPSAVALGMLDRDLETARIELLDGTIRYAAGAELAELQAGGAVSKIETLAAKGDLVQFQGRALRVKHGFAAHLVADRKELAGAIGVSPDLLRDASDMDADWTVAQVDLKGRITAEQVNRVIHLSQDRLRRGPGCLLVLRIESPGGSPADSLRLAQYLAGLDRRVARTCAFVSGFARGDAALPAFACDDLILGEQALVGGPGERHLSAVELEQLGEPLKELAKSAQRDWSLYRAMLDPKFQVFECRKAGTGETRYFSRAERDAQIDPEQWTLGAAVATENGLSASDARKLGLVRFSAERVEEIPALYGLQEQTEVLQAGWMITRIEQLAAQAWFSRTLLFVAFFAIISEASSPGIGVAGFISAISFLLYFWAQFLNGTCGWLEVLLFLGGFAFLMIELFVLPGFGVFGVGGAVMMIASIVLASQTFILPRNAYQLREMPKSMLAVGMAGMGGLAAIFLLQRYIHRTPWFRNMALPPPDLNDPDLERRESLVDFAYLADKVGVATTLIAPSGKARFGDEIIDVITEGEVVAAAGRVRVVDVRGNRVLVRAMNGPP
ncbi:MAG: hypothetical protein FJ297_15065 [Planctomycetes bacterium]|nr:hypothetical protein [Planctomycetota bacterium]